MRSLLADGNPAILAHHGTVDAPQHGDADRSRPANVDRLDTRVEWAARAVEHVPGVAATPGVAQGLEVVIEVVARRGGGGPGDVFVVADEHGRNAGERHAGDVEAVAAIQLHLVEHLRDAEAHLRSAVEESEALDALCGADDPGIAAELGRNADRFPPGARLSGEIAGPSAGEAVNLG